MSIKAENLKYVYDKKMPNPTVAVDDVSFCIEEGQVVGIIGHTGSGKSTLIQHFNGIVKPDEGKVFVDGQEITAPNTKMIDIRKKVGLVFQYPEYQLFEETVEKDVSFGPKNLKLSDEEIKDRVKEALELVGLDYDEIKDASPFDLSGGQKRRVAIAGVIAMKPRVLIMDEPTAGLDPKAHKDILQMVMDIHKKLGNTTILVSHNMEDIARMCDKILVMSEGKLIMDGTPKDIFARRKELENIGLDVPPIMQFIGDINDKGYNIDKSILDVDKLADAIKEEVGKC